MPLSRVTIALAATAAVALSAAAAQAVVVADYTNSVGPDFTFNAFDGNTTPSAAGLVVDIPDGGANNFGGFGTNTSLLATPALSPDATFSITAQLGANNAAATFNLAVSETGSTEFFVYSLPTSAFNTTGFTTLTLPLSTPPIFVNGGGDGIVNNNLAQVSVQTNNPGGPAFNLTVASIDVTPGVVPEPASLGALALGGLLLRRRR